MRNSTVVYMGIASEITILGLKIMVKSDLEFDFMRKEDDFC
jgi:hypothetical protein